MNYNYEIIAEEECYSGFYRLVKCHMRHELFEGGTGHPIDRELLTRGHAAAVLPYDPVRDELVLIEQFRVGALHSPPNPWLYEIVAGYIEPDEKPAEVCRREAVEEAGLRIGRMEFAGQYIMSPGACSEVIHFFCGEIDSSSAGGVFGLAEEGENIRASVVSFEQAMRMLSDGEIRSAPPAIALQWLALNRSRVREIWSED